MINYFNQSYKYEVMNLIQEELATEIDEVEKHLNFIEKLKDDISCNSSNLAYYQSQSRKRFEYNSMIIALYGIVEKYTEKIIKKYLEEIEAIFIVYDDVNPKIKEKHFELSIQLLSKVIDGRNKKYDNIRKEDIILNLNNCMNKSSQFMFNKDAFILNSGNIHHQKICEYFNNLNINMDQEIRMHHDFHLKTENLFNKLYELTQRRNEIAHGSSSDILNSSEITPFIVFLKKYFYAIISILQNRITYEANSYKINNGIYIDKFQIYSSGLVGLFGGAKWNLSIGDEIIIKKADGKIESSKITSVRKFEDSNDVCIKIDKKISQKSLLYIYDKKQ